MPFFDVRVCEARRVPRLGLFKQIPDTFFTLEMEDKQFKTTTNAGISSHPQWEEVFRFSCRSIRNSPLVVTLRRRNDGISSLFNESAAIGVLKINLDHPKFIQGTVDDSWYLIPGVEHCEVRLRIITHDFGANPATQQQQQQHFAQVPQHLVRHHAHQQGAVALYQLQQQVLAQNYHNSQNYPTAASNVIPPPPPPPIQQQQQQYQYQYHHQPSFWNNNNNDFSFNQNQNGVITGETLQSAPADVGFVSNAPLGYVVSASN